MRPQLKVGDAVIFYNSTSYVIQQDPNGLFALVGEETGERLAKPRPTIDELINTAFTEFEREGLSYRISDDNQKEEQQS